VTLTLVLLAASFALLVYGLASRLPLGADEPEPARPPLLYPLEARVRRELEKGGLRLAPRLFLHATWLSAAAGAAIAWPLQNRILLVVGALLGASVPWQLLQRAARRRGRAYQAAVEAALVQIARACEVRHHPLPALYDVAGQVAPPLRAELEAALDQVWSGMDLSDALRLMAARCCDNFYLHQLAELVAITTRQGGDLAAALYPLIARLRTAEELRAEQAAELFGYKTLTRLLWAASLAPLPYWALTGAPAWDLFVQVPAARAVLVWAVLSGLAIVLLPYWLALEE
jgi:hypothetical protein